jgi:glycosyltransferase involved in cell wall biosynthesis
MGKCKGPIQVVGPQFSTMPCPEVKLPPLTSKLSLTAPMGNTEAAAVGPIGRAVQVSVLINNFNYGRYLAQAIDSALSQSYKPIEVIVVDDGSTDDSRAIIARYENRIRVVLKPNGGQSSALNAGFALSRGEIICLLDSDDWYFPNKIEEVVKHFALNPSAQWVFDPVEMVFQDGTRKAPLNNAANVYVDARELAVRGKTGPGAPPTSGLSFSRTLLEQILPMCEDIFICSDNYLKFAAASIAPGLLLCKTHTAQRIHDNNAATMRKDKLLMKAKIHLMIARELKLNFPTISRFADRIFSRAAANYVRCFCRDAQCDAIILSYIKDCKIADLVDLLPRTIYNSLRFIGTSG